MRRSDGAVSPLRSRERPADASAALELAEALGGEIARRRRKMRAQVAVDRRLEVVMRRMWVDGRLFQWTRDSVGEAAGGSVRISA